MLKRKMVFCLVLASMLAYGGTAFAQADFTVGITDSEDPVAPDTVVSFTVNAQNLGDAATPNELILDVYLPMDVPVPFNDFLSADSDTQDAIVQSVLDVVTIDDDIWDADQSGVYVGDSFNNACESMIVQFQHLVLPGGSNGNVYYDEALPSSGGVSGIAYDTPGGQRVAIMNYGVGGCNSTLFDDCGTGDPAAGVPCMGPRLTQVPAPGAPIYDTNSLGCQLTGFSGMPAGAIAIVNRGTCNFSQKADNATQAGAAGVLIANPAGYGDSTPTDDSVIVMGCSDAVCHSLIITIPAAMISANDAAALRAAMAEGEVTGYMGVRQEDPEYKQTKAYIWETVATTDTNPDNDTTVETTTLSTGGQQTPCTPVYVAAAAAGAGAGTSMWATDLGITNSGSEDLTYQFQFLPRGADNTDVAMSDEMTLAANSAVNYVDIWGANMGDGAGAINVCVSDPASAGIVSRTYNTSDAGTFGQTIVGIQGETPAKLIGTNEKVRLGFLAQNSAFRTNIGFMNAGPNTIAVHGQFFMADGTSLGTRDINILPYSNNQWNGAFNPVSSGSVDLGYVDVWSDTADASFLAYASVVDNGTDDPTTIWPFDTSQMVAGGSFSGCTPVWVAAAASANGSGTTVWATDLNLTNMGSDALTYRFQFLPRAADNSAVTMSDPYTLGGNQAVAYTDIWNAMTGGQGAGAINVCVDDADNAGVVTRTYNTGPDGTFGQTIVGMRGSAPTKVSTGDKVRLGFLFENASYRTNIGFANAGSNAITVYVEFFDAAGTSLGTKGVNLAPYSNTQWNQAFTLSPINASNIEAGFADVWTDTPNAEFLTYASIVDNGTGDPTTIWPF